jgi:hypothetical protein
MHVLRASNGVLGLCTASALNGGAWSRGGHAIQLRKSLRTTVNDSPGFEGDIIGYIVSKWEC